MAHFDEDAPRKFVKRVMWMKYLQAFVAKTQQARRGYRVGYRSVIYDVFAGPGIYGGEWEEDISKYGSPLIALRVCIDFFIGKNKLEKRFDLGRKDCSLQSSGELRDYLVLLVFVEKDLNRYRQLIENIKRVFDCYGLKYVFSNQEEVSYINSTDDNIPVQCKVENNEFKNISAPFLDEDSRMVTFIDPCGYASIPLYHVKTFVDWNKEVFINLMTSYMNRFCKQNPKTADVFDIDHKELTDLKEAGGDFIDQLVDLYAMKLQNLAGTDLPVFSFEMKTVKNARLYHLLFISCHIEGVKVMKESMNRGTQEGSKFSLSEYNILRKGIPLNLGNCQNKDEVAKCIFKEFRGKTVLFADIEKFVWLETPFVFRKEPLGTLVKNENFSVKNRHGEAPKRRGTFPNPELNEWRIDFKNQESSMDT